MTWARRAWEEVNEGIAGANYGWPATEGPTTDRRFRGPIHHYPVASIAGGAFCPSGESSASQLSISGKYFFMDFVRGWIKVLDPDHPREGGDVRHRPDTAGRPGLRPDGALYVLLRDAWVVDRQLPPGHWLAAENPPRAIEQRRRADDDSSVRVSEVTIHGDMDCFQVETPTATYVYGKRGAGFASIIDKRRARLDFVPPGRQGARRVSGTAQVRPADQVLPLRLRLRPVPDRQPLLQPRDGARSRPRPHRVRDARRQVRLPVGFLPGPRDVDALADRPADVLVPLRRDAGGHARRRERLRHPPRRSEDHARPRLVAGRPLGLLRRGRDARRLRLRQPPGPGAGRDRLLRLVALRRRRTTARFGT